MDNNSKIAIILGPTACGKTAISVETAKAIGAEIISADSMQIYRGMDIGTAKATVKERCGIPHYMIDILDVTDSTFSVAKYREQVDVIIPQIQSRNKVPLIVGGTGLYINALTYPLQFGFATPDIEFRKELLKMEEAYPGILYKKLSEQDPQAAKRLHPNDTKRIVRSLEILHTSHSTQNDFRNLQNLTPPYQAVMVGLTMEREKLYRRINQRVDEMFANGLVDEVYAFYQKNYDISLPALQGIGYRQLFHYFDGKCSEEEAKEDIKRETRRYAKRQWTWFKRDARIRWFDLTDIELSDAVDMVVKYISDDLNDMED